MTTSITAVLLAAALGVAPGTPSPDTAVPETGLHVDINIPALRLTVYRDGNEFRSYRIAVGMPGAYTPTGDFTIDHAEWNPWWHPPEGREWTRDRVVTPPGPSNPMGRVKLFFTNLYFIHGTPESESIGTPASQGCVRMRNEDAIELARIIHDWGNATMSQDEIDAVLRSWRPTRHARFRQPPTLTIRYDPVEVEGRDLVIHRDVYNRNRVHVEAAYQAVMAAGMDVSDIDGSRLREVMRDVREEGGAVRIPLETVMRADIRASR